jgi:hypothetical protein
MLVIQTWHKKTLRMFWPKFPSWHSAWNVIKCCVHQTATAWVHLSRCLLLILHIGAEICDLLCQSEQRNLSKSAPTLIIHTNKPVSQNKLGFCQCKQELRYTAKTRWRKNSFSAGTPLFPTVTWRALQSTRRRWIQAPPHRPGWSFRSSFMEIL